ncbi:YaiI/YqxD family protein [Methylocella sp.]|uniref:YaiI/YqxD family protein n=1 Tax=Methylocella sp. TaxID=1978226 RepID=UPI00378458E8
MTRLDAQASPITIFVDADACPVKEEVYRVAERRAVRVVVVANRPILVPRAAFVERAVVEAGADAADDFIAARAAPGTVTITADVPLAARCVAAGGEAISPTGKAFTSANVGLALATRDLMAELRKAGEQTRGPKPFSRKDRSAFLAALDLAVVRLRRRGFS